MNVRYTRCIGAELFTSDGGRILDFLSGYCVHNLGHNHPSVIAALHDELDRSGPAMLQSHVPELAGELAAELCRLAGGRLQKVYFCSSGSEGVETVIKFARASHQESWPALLRWSISRPHLRRAFIDGRFTHGRKALRRCCRALKVYPLPILAELETKLATKKVCGLCRGTNPV